MSGHARHRVGTPAGGQFAPRDHAEAEMPALLDAGTPRSRLNAFVQAHEDDLVPGCENIAWDLAKGDTLLVERSFGTGALRLSIHPDVSSALSQPSTEALWLVEGVHDLATGEVFDEATARALDAQGTAP